MSSVNPEDINAFTGMLGKLNSIQEGKKVVDTEAGKLDRLAKNDMTAILSAFSEKSGTQSALTLTPEAITESAAKPDQVGAEFEPKKISPVLGEPEKDHPMQGMLVGENTQLRWSELDEGLSCEDRMTVVENHYAQGSLTENLDHEHTQAFKNLFSLGDEPVVGTEYFVVPLTLVDNRVMQLDDPKKLTLASQQQNQLTFEMLNGKKITYPSDYMRDRSFFHTFVFETTRGYDKFRTALQMRFDVSLPELGSVKEDSLSDIKKRLGDYFQDIKSSAKVDDKELSNKANKEDQLGPAIKTIKTDDGKEIKIHGNEDDGFRLKINEKMHSAKFNSFDEAQMACETYVAKRKSAMENQDYVEEK